MKISKEQREQFRVDFQTMTHPQLAEKYGVTKRAVTWLCNKLGLERDKAWINQKAKENRKPYHCANRKPPERKIAPDGTIKQRKCDGRVYLMIVVNAKWEHLHRYNWLQAGNELPKGHRLTFLDGNTLNCEVSNLRTKRGYQRRDPLWGQRTLQKQQEAERRRQEREAAKEQRQAEKARKAAEKQAKREAESRRRHDERRRLQREASALRKAERVREREQESKRKESERKTRQIKRQWEEKSRRSSKREEASRLPTKTVDYSQMQKVFIKEKRMWVYMRPGQTIEEVKRKYAA